MLSVCCCSIWTRSSLEKGPLIDYSPALDPPLGRFGPKVNTNKRGLEYFIPTKFGEYPSSDSVVKVDYVFQYIYTTQKKFRISCAYFFVLSISNSCRLWRGLQIKVKFSEDVSYMTISNFCEKQFVLNDTTLIVQKSLFWPKNAKLHLFYV